MASDQEDSDRLQNFTDEQLSELVKANDALDQEEARIINDDLEEKLETAGINGPNTAGFHRDVAYLLHRTLELANPLAQRRSDLRKALGSKKE